jgi:copper chaperone
VLTYSFFGIILKAKGGRKMSSDVVIFTVPDMSCSHCENTIKTALLRLNGVDNVNIDLQKKKVSIEYEGTKISSEILKSTIEDQGYDVK